MTYRQIHTEMWDDDWTIELEPMAKLLWVYLFSNSRTHYIGLYELPKKKASFDTGLSVTDIAAILARFEQAGKIKTNGSWIWVKNMLVRNVNNLGSPKIQTGILKAFRDVPNSCPFKMNWLEHYNGTIVPQFGIPAISHDTVSYDIPAADTFCPATASVSDLSCPVSDLEGSPEEVETTAPSEAIDVFLKATGGAVNPLHVDQINDLVDEAEEHRLALPRASPGAGVSGDGWIAAVIREANASRKPGSGTFGLNYPKTIFDRWKVDGFKSPLGGVKQILTEADAW